MATITTALIPIAGLGTRFQPFSHAAGKEFLPIFTPPPGGTKPGDNQAVAKPIIHLAMEEAAAAGARRFVFVISPSRRSNLENYLKPAAELKRALAAKGEDKLLKMLDFLADTEATIVEQPRADGLADAVYLAKDALGDEPFFMLLPDDVLTPSALAPMAKRWRGKCLIATTEVAADKISAYGMVSRRGEIENNGFAIDRILEKPKPEQITSNLVVIGRYIFTAKIFPAIAAASNNKETQMTEAMDALAKADQLEGFSLTAADIRRFDCGSANGWLETNLAMAGKE